MGVWDTWYIGTPGTLVKDEQGDDIFKSGFSEFSYSLLINTKNSDEFCIRVISETDSFDVIHAASEQEAGEVLYRLLRPKKSMTNIIIMVTVIILLVGVFIICILRMRSPRLH